MISSVPRCESGRDSNCGDLDGVTFASFLGKIGKLLLIHSIVIVFIQ